MHKYFNFKYASILMAALLVICGIIVNNQRKAIHLLEAEAGALDQALDAMKLKAEFEQKLNTAPAEKFSIENLQKIACKKIHNVLGFYVENYQGFKLIIDVCDANLLVDSVKGGTKSEILKAIKSITNEKDTVLIIGAHIGTDFLTYAHLIGKKGLAIAIEPDPKAFDLLFKNILINNIPNAKLHKFAAYDSIKQLNFLSSTSGLTNGGNSSIFIDKLERNAELVEVKASTLDHELAYVHHLNVMQLDTNGSEPNAIRGAKDLIKRSPDLIILQHWNSPKMIKQKNNLTEYVDLLTGYGFKLAKISFDELKPLSVAELTDPKLVCDVIITKDLPKYDARYKAF